MKRLLIVAIAVIVAACGGSSTAPGTTPAPPDRVSDDCADALVDLTDALTEIDSRLNVGLTYANYSERLADARVAYDKVKFSDLDGDCIRGAGKPSEAAMNEYIKAYTTWKACIDKSGCDTASIKTELQGHWTTATGLLAQVKGRLP